MKYLVPFDFTPITTAALQHALRLSDTTGAEIEILHVVKSESESEQAFARLVKVKGELEEALRNRVTPKVRVGNIFEDIGGQAKESEADLLVMGTHGARGFQKLFGSHAMKVITNSDVPFIITQAKGPNKSIDLIVLPVDMTKESVQVVDFAAKLARTFDAEVQLVFRPEKDEWLAKKLKVNIGSARIQLQKHDVQFAVNELDGKKDFQTEVSDYAAKFRADLVAITHFSDSILPQFDTFSQDMITNKFEIPVLIVTAKMVKGIRSNYAFMTI